MFQRILAPVDLAHLDTLDRALNVAAEAARQNGASVVYVSVGAAAPGPIAHTPEEFTAKLDSFAADQAARHGISGSAMAVISHDPTSDLNETLLKAIDEAGADLVVMASHKPGLADYFFHSNGGEIAARAGVSVFIVRDA